MRAASIRAAALPDQALDQGLFGHLLEHAGPCHALGVPRGIGEGIERTLRHADDRRNQRGRAEGRIAETRLAVVRDLKPGHLAGEDRAKRQDAVLRNEDRLGDVKRFRSGALQPADIPAVVIDHDVR